MVMTTKTTTMMMRNETRIDTPMTTHTCMPLREVTRRYLSADTALRARHPGGQTPRRKLMLFSILPTTSRHPPNPHLATPPSRAQIRLPTPHPHPPYPSQTPIHSLDSYTSTDTTHRQKPSPAHNATPRPPPSLVDRCIPEPEPSSSSLPIF